MSCLKRHSALFVCVLMAMVSRSQSVEPDLTVFRDFENAYIEQTRSMNGQPGENYWQNQTNYQIDAMLDVDKSWLYGSANMTYYNNSPDTLNEIVFHLYQNLTKTGATRAFSMRPFDVGEGVSITSITMNGAYVDITDEAVFKVRDTNGILKLDQHLVAGDSISLLVEWNYHIPEDWQLRTGKGDSSSYFIAYWYPKIAVYDDVSGWDKLPYNGLYEFYNDYGDFDVSIKVPNSYGVWATGTIQNLKDVLTEALYRKWERSKVSGQVTKLIEATAYLNGANPFRENDNINTWRFKAKNVPDFAFTFGDHYLWDASSVEIKDGGRVLVNAVYRDEANDFRQMVNIASQIIEYHSNDMPGILFPYPHMTVVQGTNSPSDGGMEFPMICNNPTSNEIGRAADIASHEIAHQYFPFLVGTNERRYGWMDEGWAAMLPVDLIDQIDSTRNRQKTYAKWSKFFAGQSGELPIMTPTYLLNTFSYAYPTYMKPALAYRFLREELGDELFLKCIQEYVKRWESKHPIPYDFFFTFNGVSGKNLNWFWEAWFFEKYSPDLAIKEITVMKGKSRIVIENMGGLPLPVELNLKLANGEFATHMATMGVWKDGTRYEFETEGEVESAVLGNLGIPDLELDNNNYSVN